MWQRLAPLVPRGVAVCSTTYWMVCSSVVWRGQVRQVMPDTRRVVGQILCDVNAWVGCGAEPREASDCWTPWLSNRRWKRLEATQETNTLPGADAILLPAGHYILSTFSHNAAVWGGAIHNLSGTVMLLSAIVANSPMGGNCFGSAIVSLGHSLDSGPPFMSASPAESWVTIGAAHP